MRQRACQAHAHHHLLLQVPVLRTEYQRTAFQRYDSNALRISLDANMLLLREQPPPADGGGGGAASGAWCGAGGLEAGPVPGGDVVRFPYGVLEVKLQEATPQWVKVGQGGRATGMQGKRGGAWQAATMYRIVRSLCAAVALV